MQYLHFIDLFGVPFNLKFSKDQDIYKSLIGGVTTAFVYTLSLIYFIYIMIIWQQNEFQPNAVKFIQASNYSKLELQNEPIFDLTFWKYKQDLIDPFTEQNNILMPLMIVFTNGIQGPAIPLLGNYSLSTYNSVLMQLRDLKLIHNINYEGYPRTEVMILIVKCDQQYLKSNQSCASDDLIQSYEAQGPNHLTYSIYMKTYNSRTKQLDQVKKEIYMVMDKQLMFLNQISIKQAFTTINDGLLFQNLKSLQYVDDATFVSQSVSQDYGKQFLGINSEFSFILRLDPIYTQNSIRYLNIGEILAMVGSIVSVLMSIGIGIQYFNKYSLQNYLEYQVLNQYMPSQFQTNIFGKVNKIKGLPQLQSNRIMPQLIEIAQKKFNILNLVYQISRIELFLIKKFGKQELLKANQYELLLERSDQESFLGKQDNFTLNDIELFSYSFRDTSTVGVFG